MKNLFKLCLLVLLSSHAFAESKAIQLEGAKLGKIPVRVLGSAKYRNANFESKDKDAFNPRHLNGFGADAMAGLILGPVFIGAGGEYMSWLQATDPKDESDVTGSSVSMFGSVGLAAGRFLILGKYFFSSTYNVNKADSNGDKLKFSEPEGSYSVGVIYRFGKRSFINVDYSSITYGKLKSGSSSTTLTSDQKISFTSVGLSYGLMF